MPNTCPRKISAQDRKDLQPLFTRIANMLAYGSSVEDIRAELIKDYDDEEIFLAFCAAKTLLW